jgi:hypothetical protein
VIVKFLRDAGDVKLSTIGEDGIGGLEVGIRLIMDGE